MTEPAFDPLGALRTLSAHGVRFVLIGGYAAALRGSPMLTGDLDICFARDDANLEALAAALREGGLQATLRDAPEDVPFRLDAATLKAGDHFTFSDRSWGHSTYRHPPSGTDGSATSMRPRPTRIWTFDGARGHARGPDPP